MKTLQTIVEGILDVGLEKKFDVPASISKFVAKLKSLPCKLEYRDSEFATFYSAPSDPAKDFHELVKILKSGSFSKEKVKDIKSEYENDEDCCIVTLISYQDGTDIIYVYNPAVPECIGIDFTVHIQRNTIKFLFYTGKPCKARMKEIINAQRQSKIHLKYPSLVYDLIKSSITS